MQDLDVNMSLSLSQQMQDKKKKKTQLLIHIFFSFTFYVQFLARDPGADGSEMGESICAHNELMI